MERSSLQEAAIDFCSREGDQMGVSVATFSRCVKAVVAGVEDSHSQGSEVKFEQDHFAVGDSISPLSTLEKKSEELKSEKDVRFFQCFALS